MNVLEYKWQLFQQQICVEKLSREGPPEIKAQNFFVDTEDQIS
jgi:hypothetical protein